MQLRKLGRSTLEIFPLSLGTNVLGRAIDEPTAFAVLDPPRLLCSMRM